MGEQSHPTQKPNHNACELVLLSTTEAFSGAFSPRGALNNGVNDLVDSARSLILAHAFSQRRAPMGAASTECCE